MEIRNEANCEDCAHRCVCKHKDEAQKVLEEERGRPVRCFGSLEAHVANIMREVWLECNYYQRDFLIEEG